MKRKSLSLLILLAVSLIVEAHEFWLETAKYRYAIGESAVVSFKVGENFFGDPWQVKKDRLEKVDLHSIKTVKDLKQTVKEGDKENLTVPLPTEGTYMLAMQTNNTFSELKAEEFNAYLKEDGLDDVYNKRKKSNTLETPGKELYARYSKVLLQAGKRTDDTYKKNAGLPIEIIPQQNPYTRKVGDPVKFLILFNGKPLFGALVKVWNRNNNRTSIQNIYSMQDGI